MSDEKSVLHDPVNRPSHYVQGGLEAIDVIEAFDLGFRAGNAVKYLLRAGKKGDRLEDLKKARWYIDREIRMAEKVADKAAEEAHIDEAYGRIERAMRAESAKLRVQWITGQRPACTTPGCIACARGRCG